MLCVKTCIYKTYISKIIYFNDQNSQLSVVSWATILLKKLLRFVELFNDIYVGLSI